ncbi:MAG: hypothetical protein M1816_007150 [Peltula sp. TS41687]|nr:MAG: hypothetical protein M1816_007150 [Peltula sp. TS41687]
MADSSVNRHTYPIKDLDTTSITLSPQTATVVRQIDDVVLKPGPNEITLYGLTSTTEDHSLQVNGQGAAFITDMTVECVPSNDRSDILDFSDSEDDDDDDELDQAEDEPDQEIKDIDAAIESLKQELTNVTEGMQSTSVKIGFLGSYGNTLDSKETMPNEVVRYLELYDEQRKRLDLENQKLQNEKRKSGERNTAEDQAEDKTRARKNVGWNQSSREGEKEQEKGN